MCLHVFRSRAVLPIAPFALAATLAACSGGGASSPIVGQRTPATSSPSPNAPAANATVVFHLVIPAAAAQSSRARRPAYVSPATNSISVAQSGGTPQTISLASGSTACTTNGGTRTCTLDLGAVPGTNQSFTIKAFASTDGSGVPLSLQTIVATITPGIANTLDATLDGVVAALSLSLSSPTLRYGHSGTTNAVINALDASNQIIIGPGTFADASGNAVTVTLTDGDRSGATSFTASPASQATSIPIAYSGAAITRATFTVSSGSLPSQSATLDLVCGTPSTTQQVYTTANLSNSTMPGFTQSAENAGFYLDAPHEVFASTLGQIAVDPRGFAYVTVSRPSGTPYLAQYCPSAFGSETPYRSLTGMPFANASDLALDAQNDLYAVSYGTNAIYEYASDSGVQGAPGPSTPASSPIATISGSSTALSAPIGVTIDASGRIYAANTNQITVYSKGANGNVAPSSLVTNTAAGLLNLRDARVDAAGNVYALYDSDNRQQVSVAQGYGAPALAVFSHGSFTTPSRVITGAATGLGGNGGNVYYLALDPIGNMFVESSSVDSGGNAVDLVEEFAAGANGNVAPVASFTVQSGVADMAVDSSDSVALSTNSIGVLIYRSGSLAAVIQPQASENAYGIAFDALGDLVVQFRQSVGGMVQDALLTYPPNATTTSTPIRSLVDTSNTYLEGKLAIDAAGTIYGTRGINVVGSGGTLATYAGNVDEFTSAATTEMPSSSFRASVLNGLGVDSGGTIYTGDPSNQAVKTFAAGTSGNSASPTGMYRDYRPSTLRTTAVTVDANGYLYAASCVSPYAISVYAPGSYSAPVRSILGPNTDVSYTASTCVESMAIDANGNLVVLTPEPGINIVNTYAAGASGNVAPISTFSNLISSSASGLTNGIAIGPGFGM